MTSEFGDIHTEVKGQTIKYCMKGGTHVFIEQYFIAFTSAFPL